MLSIIEHVDIAVHGQWNIDWITFVVVIPLPVAVTTAPTSKGLGVSTLALVRIVLGVLGASWTTRTPLDLQERVGELPKYSRAQMQPYPQE